MPTLTAEQQRFARILTPHRHKRQVALAQSRTRIVHYTSASAAMNILRGRSMWLRNANCMNDTREIQHGLEMLAGVFRNTSTGSKFRGVLDNLFPGLAAEVGKLFDEWAPNFLLKTYIACFSEHEDKEDEFGRLSMWRAYGDRNRVALILNNDVFLSPAEGLGAYAMAVLYAGEVELENELKEIANNIVAEAAFLRARGREAVKNDIFQTLRVYAVSTKHPGFQEEKEWRVIHCPGLDETKHITNEIRLIGDVPQPIYAIPLENIPDIGLEAEIPRVLYRVIIGPSQYPVALGYAFSQLLCEAGVSDADNKIHISKISLRQ
jgi:hypothetical protein